jgi:hypothetical protein
MPSLPRREIFSAEVPAKVTSSVIPAKAGIQLTLEFCRRLRGNLPG